VRSGAELPQARSAVEKAWLQYQVLDERRDGSGAMVSISTMHRAKGLEFRAVVVMACDDDVIPSQQRIEEVGDDADLGEVYATERHLLYVACTRARDHLLVTAVEPWFRVPGRSASRALSVREGSTDDDAFRAP
jgi:superfamily I DNA/RNA helicase